MKKIALILLPVLAAVVCLQIPPAWAGKITGVITYEGEVPKLPTVKMDADPICITHHGKPVESQLLVLGGNKELANVFVHITEGVPPKQYPVPEEPAVLDQKGCIYNPRVMGLRVGQTLKILNPDGTLHNVHAMTQVNEEFNIAMPKFRKEITRVFDKPEFMLSMKCDVHPWMGAWITVLEHPFFNVTGKDGRYVIDNLPAGEYTLQIWHEKLGTQEEKVILAEGEEKEVNFVMSR